MRRIIALLCMLLSVPLVVGASPEKSLFLEEIGADTTLPNTGEYVYLFSPGGRIDTAFALVPQVKDKTCIVFGAASAALLIVMPACKERYFVRGGIVQFHSAVIITDESTAITQWDAAYIAEMLASANTRILAHLMEYQVPWTAAFTLESMRTDARFVGDELKQWGSWLRPVEECFHCPLWTKLVKLDIPGVHGPAVEVSE